MSDLPAAPDPIDLLKKVVEATRIHEQSFPQSLGAEIRATESFNLAYAAMVEYLNRAQAAGVV